ncbi:MAG TPA: hypothetical protein VL053_08510 [Arachidicoccus sp.]|nr:hypothetical protein [Arachidicoccus sp.]
MSLIKTIKRLEYANFLIKKRATGNLDKFALKMKLSKRAVCNLIAEMREMGAVILYDRIKKTYYYGENGEMSISKFMLYGQVLTRDECAEMGKPEEMCFSEKAVFILCKDI